MIVRGTTPTHIFTLPMDTGGLQSVRVLYTQGDVVKLRKEGADIALDGRTVTCKLSQADTLSLDAELRCKIQLRLLTLDNVALVSRPIREDVGECFEDEVMT